MSHCDEWVSVDKRLPKKGQLVLVYEKDGRIIPAVLKYPEWGTELEFYVQLTQCDGCFDDEYPTLDVTHWMKIPSKP